MANSLQGRAFINSFMQGFSFVDDINTRKRQEAKLEERLRREEDERIFQRKRLEQRDAERGADRARTILREQQSDRERSLGLAATAEALKPEGQRDEDVIQAGLAFSGRAQDLRASQNRQAEVLQALQDVQGSRAPTVGAVGGAQGQGLAAGAAQVATGAPAQPAQTEAELSLLAPSRGRDTTQSVDLDAISRAFDPDAPQGNFFQRVIPEVGEEIEGFGASVTGAFRGLSTGAANLVNQGVNAVFGTDLPPVASGASVGEALSGNVELPEAYVTPQEFESITDPTELEAARRTNTRILEEVKELGLRRLNNPDASRLEQLQAGSRAQRAEAQRHEFLVTQKYEGFSDPEVPNKVRAMTLDDPAAGVATYFTDRATLQSANPQLATQMDIAMQEPIRRATAERQQALANATQGTPEFARAQRELRSLQVTQKQIYEDYSPSEQAGIDDRGMRIGNAELSGRVMDVVNDPNRPRPTAPLDSAQIRAASTMVNRMSGGRRATDRQLKAALVLKDAGILGAQDIAVLNMTGSLPTAKPELKQFKPGPVFAVGPDGSIKQVMTVPELPSKLAAARAKTGKAGKGAGSNQLTPQNIDQFMAGVNTVFPEGQRGSEEFALGQQRMLLDMSEWVQNNVDLTDPLAPHRLGVLFAQSHFLAAEEDNWFPAVFGDFEPTPEEIIRDPVLRTRLALEHDIPIIGLETAPRNPDFDVNSIRQDLQIPGKWPAEIRQLALDPNVTDDFLLQTLFRDAALEERTRP